MEVKKCFQRTYEELKPIKRVREGEIIQKFSAYLWGIETQLRWGWNGSQAFRFQRTYEELKLRPPWMGKPLEKPRFQRTYEELKLDILPEKAAEILCFQRTYEELKHQDYWEPKGMVYFVFSVPMRNWNWGDSFPLSYPPNPFSAYLWGIETF